MHVCMTDNKDFNGPLLKGPGKISHPESHRNRLQSCFIHIPNYEQRFSLSKKFQACAPLCFWIEINQKWLCGPEKFLGLWRKLSDCPTQTAFA